MWLYDLRNVCQYMPQDAFPFSIRIRHGAYDDEQRADDALFFAACSC